MHPIPTFTHLLNIYQDSISSVTTTYLKQTTNTAYQAIQHLTNTFLHYQHNMSKRQIVQVTHSSSTNPESVQGQSQNKSTKLYPNTLKKQIYVNSVYNPSQDSILDALQRETQEDSLLIDDSQLYFPHKSSQENYQRKTIVELLQQSESKANKNKFNQCQDIVFCHMDEESEYQMSDYSSNQTSSNESDKQQRYVTEIFDGFFNKKKTSSNMATQATQGTQDTQETQNENKQNDFSKANKKLEPKFLKFNLNFKPKINFIMESPKKEKGKKRLFIGRKKVPKWASDLEAVKQMNRQCLRTQQSNIFGRCIVEDLNTNIMFQQHEKITRTSSAKWNSRSLFLK